MGLYPSTRQRRHVFSAISILLFCLPGAGAQATKPAAAYPDHLPYEFSNFLWWTDADLRSELKKRIPGLTDEIAVTRADESRMRDALTALLKQKGVTADVLSEEPSTFSLTGQRATGAPAPAIVFSILNPQILVDQTAVTGAPESDTPTLAKLLDREHGREYSSLTDWRVLRDSRQQLERAGYFGAEMHMAYDQPRREGDHYVVNLTLSIDPGPQYHIGEITGDGGPLLQGRDLSSAFKLKQGDPAVGSAWGSLGSQLRSFYTRFGYADVIVSGDPILDRENALASYHLSVTPGPLYHLRSLTIHNLNSGQESKVRRLFALGPGDTFDETAINNLYRQVDTDSSLSGYTFSFSPRKDAEAGLVDLTLNFSLKTDQPRVIVH